MGQHNSNFAPRKNKTHKNRKAMEKTNTPAKTQVYNLVILDKSGSMESIRKEAIDGYNETLGAIRAAQLKHMDTQDHFVSLAAFCGFTSSLSVLCCQVWLCTLCPASNSM